MKKKRLWLFIVFLSFTLMFCGGAIALAQEDVEEDVFMLEEIVATGSRIAREEGFGQTSPVTVIGQEDISSFGFTRIEDIMFTLPQIETHADHNAYQGNTSTGTAALDLRGLSPKRTLTLMNGRRMQMGGVWTMFTDVNQVPAGMIERVEVLTGGASAVYGADAVAGVVNFIYRDVEGVELSIGGSGYQHKNDNSFMQGLLDEAGYDYPDGSSGIDGEAYNIDLMMGGEFADGKGNATLYATYRENEELIQGDRDYSACSLWSLGGGEGMCGGSTYGTDIPNFMIMPMIDNDPNGMPDWSVMERVTLDANNNLVQPISVYNYNPPNHYQRPDERWSIGAIADYQVNEKINAYMEMQYFTDYTRAQIAESGTFHATEHVLPADYSMFPENFQSSLQDWFPGATWFNILHGKRNTEGGPRYDIQTHDSFRGVAGIEGAFNDAWNYDISYLRARTHSTSTYINDLMETKIMAALDVDACAVTDGCIPYEVFTYQGITPEQAAFLSGTGTAATDITLDVVSGVIDGDLGMGLDAGDIFVVAGTEYRRETYDRIMDSIYSDGLLLGQGGSTPSFGGSFNVFELFGEANVPLLADMPGVENLTLDLALRWSDHSITGSDATYRVGLDWQTNDMLRVRTNYNRAVRSPNVEEFFYPSNVGLWNGIDRCAGSDPLGNYGYTQEMCARTGVTAAQYGNVPENQANQYYSDEGGNPDLQPEVADTITFGIVVEPLKTLRLSLDYWNIDIEDSIDIIGAETIIGMCATTGALCDQIHRNQVTGGDLFITEDGYVEDSYQNIGKQQWEGIDFAAAYWLDAMQGTFNANLVGSYMLTKETTAVAGDPDTTYDCVGIMSASCYPTPEWRHTASVSYDSHEFWTVSARWRFLGSVDYTGDELAQNMGATSYFDLGAQFRFWQNHDIMVGINNVFDKEPPLVSDGLSGAWGNANSIPGIYDSLGRFLYTKVNFRF